MVRLPRVQQRGPAGAIQAAVPARPQRRRQPCAKGDENPPWCFRLIQVSQESKGLSVVVSRAERGTAADCLSDPGRRRKDTPVAKYNFIRTSCGFSWKRPQRPHGIDTVVLQKPISIVFSMGLIWYLLLLFCAPCTTGTVCGNTNLVVTVVPLSSASTVSTSPFRPTWVYSAVFLPHEPCESTVSASRSIFFGFGLPFANRSSPGLCC